MVRGAFGISEGTWYYEIEILEHEGNTRLGWSTEKGDVQAPVGYDKYSYSFRDKEGTKFHQSRGSPYGSPYGPGDVIGFWLHLPPKPNREIERKLEPPPDSLNKKKEDEEPPRLDNSEIRFFKNGIDQGVAFSNVYEGTYYPAGSLYGGAVVKFNFGPKFKYPPSKEKPYLACCDMVSIALQKAAAQKAAEDKAEEERLAQEKLLLANGIQNQNVMIENEEEKVETETKN